MDLRDFSSHLFRSISFGMVLLSVFVPKGWSVGNPLPLAISRPAESSSADYPMEPSLTSHRSHHHIQGLFVRPYNPVSPESPPPLEKTLPQYTEHFESAMPNGEIHSHKRSHKSQKKKLSHHKQKVIAHHKKNAEKSKNPSKNAHHDASSPPKKRGKLFRFFESLYHCFTCHTSCCCSSSLTKVHALVKKAEKIEKNSQNFKKDISDVEEFMGEVTSGVPSLTVAVLSGAAVAGMEVTRAGASVLETIAAVVEKEGRLEEERLSLRKKQKITNG